MPEPEPAKTKMSMEMNSAMPARKVSGWESSPGEPMAILLTGIFDRFFAHKTVCSELCLPVPGHSASVWWWCVSQLQPIYIVRGIDERTAGELARASHDRFKQGWLGSDHEQTAILFFPPDVMGITNTIVFLLGGNNLDHGIDLICVAMINVVVVVGF
jgi:hypothetical protein